MLEALKYLSLCARIHGVDMLHDEKGEVNIVATVVLCGVAVILAITFKDQIKNLIETLVGQITQNAQKAIKVD